MTAQLLSGCSLHVEPEMMNECRALKKTNKQEFNLCHFTDHRAWFNSSIPFKTRATYTCVLQKHSKGLWSFNARALRRLKQCMQAKALLSWAECLQLTSVYVDLFSSVLRENHWHVTHALLQQTMLPWPVWRGPRLVGHQAPPLVAPSGDEWNALKIYHSWQSLES